MKLFKTIGYSAILFLLPFVAHAQVALTDPLGITDPRLIATRLIQGAIGISGTLALLMTMYGGFLWMTAMGKPEQVDKGKKVLTWAVLGIILIASAYALTTALFNAILTGSVTVTP